MKIYIAGCISKGATLSVEEQRANREAFDRKEEELRDKGHEPVNPFSLKDIPYATDRQQWRQALRIDLAALLNCDAILLLKGWEHSPGARLEEYVAQEVGLTVMTEAEG